MNFKIIKLKLFLFHHLNRPLLAITIILIVNTFLYYYIYLDEPELFNGAYELGLIFNVLSLSFIASYIFYFINYELPGFDGKVKSYMLFFERKLSIDYMVDTLINQFVKEEENWNKLKFKEKSNLIEETLKYNYFLEKGLLLNPPELDKEITNNIVEFHLEKVGKVINQIQNEFDRLNVNSRYLNSKLYLLISVIQNLNFFHKTYMFYSMGEMSGIKEWSYKMFTVEYASAIDHLIKISTVFNNEINPYWDLVKEKSTIDILD